MTFGSVETALSSTAVGAVAAGSQFRVSDDECREYDGRRWYRFRYSLFPAAAGEGAQKEKCESVGVSLGRVGGDKHVFRWYAAFGAL